MTVRIVTDSTVDLPTEIVEELQIEVVPLSVVIENKPYKEGIEISKDEFYSRISQSDVSASTSAPSIGDFQSVYESLARDKNDIISIHLSSKLSATYNNANKAIENLSNHDNEVHIIDSRSTSMAMGFIVTMAANAAKQGCTAKEISDIVHRNIPRVHLIFTLSTLDFLRKGGRIGRASSFLGSMLNIRPILSLRDGEVYPEQKVRSRTKSINEMIKFTNSFPEIGNVVVGYSTDMEEAQMVRDRLIKDHQHIDIRLTKLGPVIGAHTGPGVIGIGLIEKES